MSRFYNGINFFSVYVIEMIEIAIECAWLVIWDSEAHLEILTPYCNLKRYFTHLMELGYYEACQN